MALISVNIGPQHTVQLLGELSKVQSSPPGPSTLKSASKGAEAVLLSRPSIL